MVTRDPTQRRTTRRPAAMRPGSTSGRYSDASSCSAMGSVRTSSENPLASSDSSRNPEALRAAAGAARAASFG